MRACVHGGWVCVVWCGVVWCGHACLVWVWMCLCKFRYQEPVSVHYWCVTVRFYCLWWLTNEDLLSSDHYHHYQQILSLDSFPTDCRQMPLGSLEQQSIYIVSFWAIHKTFNVSKTCTLAIVHVILPSRFCVLFTKTSAFCWGRVSICDLISKGSLQSLLQLTHGVLKMVLKMHFVHRSLFNV